MAAPTPTGFDGLSSFSTDAAAAIASAERILASPPPPKPASPQSGPPANPVHSDGLAASGNTNTGWGIAAIVIFVVGIFVAVAINSSDNSYSDDIDSYESPEAPAEEALSADSTIALSDDAEDETSESDAESFDSSIGEFGSEPDYSSLPGPGDETKPSPGYAPLTMSEIQYCLAEEIRLTAQKSELESLEYTDPERMSRNLDDFNSAIEEFNSLCGGRQFVASQRSIAEASIGARRFTLQSEGRNRVQ